MALVILFGHRASGINRLQDYLLHRGFDSPRDRIQAL